MLEYRRYRDASAVLAERFEASAATSTARRRCRRAAPGRGRGRDRRLRPRAARRRARRPADRAARRRHQPHPPDRLAGAPPARPARRPPPPHQLRLRRGVRRRGPADPGGDDLRPARALPQGRGDLGADGAVCGPITGAQSGARMSDLTRTVEALLFLSPQPVSVADLAMATEATEGQVAEAIELLREDLAEGRRGIVLREVARRLRARQRPGQRGGRAAPAGEAADAAADPGAGGDAGDRRLPAAGLPARGRPHPRRLLGVGGARRWPSAA